MIPKLDFTNGIPEEYASMVIIPTIVKSKEKVEEIMKKLEVYYLANKSENIYFTLLADCTSSSKEIEEYDKEVENSGINVVKQLNEKYKQEGMPIFNFVYRNRIWNDKESAFLGWERKRGYINQFNKYILGKSKNVFKINTIEEWKKNTRENIPKIKYIITLDSDTDLTLNSGFELIGAMAHILNKPVIAKNKKAVIDGHALIQPRVGVSLLASRKSLFTQIFAGPGGTDSYANAISDVYQDNFSEGIFTGKGIYDVKIFEEILENEIPENTVLSHDLLEGNYLRCGLATDILLMDGYPVSYMSFKTRLHRWIRGDFQIIDWAKRKVKNKDAKEKINPLNMLSKYKILDNIFRSQFEVFCILSFLFLLCVNLLWNIRIWPLMTIILAIIFMPLILDIVNKIVFKKEGKLAQNTYAKTITRNKGKLYKRNYKFNGTSR